MRTSLRLTAALLLTVFVLVASVTPAVAQGGDTTRIKLTVKLSSQQTILEQVGRGGDITYGWNQLTGTAATDSGDVDVQLLGNVEYLNGSGRFFGSLTLELASLSTLGLDVEGRAKLRDDGSTRLESKLRVIGGSAAMTGARGKGTMNGERRDDLGGAIEVTIDVRLRGLS